MDKNICMEDPHRHLIETICRDVLPNMVRIYESKRMSSVLDRDRFVTIIEQKIELANKSLPFLSPEDQVACRAMIDRAYAENIDRIRSGTSDPVNACIPGGSNH